MSKEGQGATQALRKSLKRGSHGPMPACCSRATPQSESKIPAVRTSRLDAPHNKDTLRASSLIGALSLLLAVPTAFADVGGCVDSPENPSIILGLLGAAAASVPWLRAQLKSRSGKRSG